MLVEFDTDRANRYETAMRRAPAARAAEITKLQAVLHDLGAIHCERVVDLGAGHGYATTTLLDHVGADGVIFAVDNSPHMLQRIRPDPRIKPLVAPLDQLEIESNSIDVIVSLAMFHHVSHKTLVMREIRRCLRPGGFCVIADVNEATPTQQFFDHVVRSHCKTGHDFDFLDAAWVRLIASRAELQYVSSSVERTDWQFADEATMLAYLSDLLSLVIEPGELRLLVQRWLYPSSSGGRFILPWSLGYHVLSKA